MFSVTKEVQVIRTDGSILDKLIKQFEELSALQEEAPTAWQLIWKLISIKGWNRSVFCERTGLEETIYYKAKRNDSKTMPAIHTIVTICVSMDLSRQAIDELLAAAGIQLSKAIPSHRAYLFVINILEGESIAVRNEFLDRVGLGKPPTQGDFDK